MECLGSAVDIDKLTLKQLFEGMVQSFMPEEAKGLDTVIQYDITGEGGGKFYMVISEQRCTLHEGEAEDPRITIAASKDDWYAVAKGELDGASAFLTGRLRTQGNMSDLMRMQSLFKYP